MGLIIICILGIIFIFVTSQEYATTAGSISSIENLVPSEPFNLSIIKFNATTFELFWSAPTNTSVPIEGYRIYLDASNYTENITLTFDNPSAKFYEYTVSNLSPNTEYHLFIKSYNNNFESNSSNVIVQKTDIFGPSAPIIVKFTCLNNAVLSLEWKRPNLFYGNIQLYYILILVDTELVDNITIPTSKNFLQTSYTIPNVTTNKIYTVEISAASLSEYTGKLVYGNISSQNVDMQPDCEDLEASQYVNGKLHEQLILIGFIMLIIFLLVGFLIFSYKRYCQPPERFIASVSCVVSTTDLGWNNIPEPIPIVTDVEDSKEMVKEKEVEYLGPIKIEMYNSHVARLHVDGDVGFSKEFEAIQATQEEYPSIHSLLPENRPKNRYLNITAYDHNRVLLLSLPRRRKNYDYINANYLDGFEVSKAFIGTQGPLPNTYEDFWRMVWEQKVLVIVMITNLIEKGRRKCDMYWPEENSALYGCMKVTLVKEEVMATFTVRIFKLTHRKIKTQDLLKKEKLVYQYHYTNWPDHGTPDHPLPLLHFVKKTSALNSKNCGPMVVHCSAGVGRTGTYILLDAMLKQIHFRNEVNVFGFLRYLRGQRNFLVQTEEQYVFIHDTLLEAILSKETNISQEKYSTYVQALISNTTNEHDRSWQSLEMQFKLVTSFQAKEFHITYAHKEINKPKNRANALLPMDDSRVHLQPKAGQEGSDYVNGTWMQGFEFLREFIVTQHPMQNTISDFWKMVWDHSAQIIVMISIIDNQDFEVFWPPEYEVVTSPSFKIESKSVQNISHFVVRDYHMQSISDGYELSVRMIESLNWPHNCSSASEIWELINAVDDIQVGYKNGGPIVIVDRFGGSEASIFGCLFSVKKQLLYEKHADLYMFAKLFHNKRQGVWPCRETYLTMHLALQAFCEKSEKIDKSNKTTVLNSCLLKDCTNLLTEANGKCAIPENAC